MPLNFLKKLAAGLGQGKVDGASHWRALGTLDQGHIDGACFAMDRHGRGHALWGNSGKLWTQQLGPGVKESLGRFPLSDGRDPSMAMNLEGRGVAVWILDAIFQREIMGLPFDPTSEERPAIRSLFKSSGEIRHMQLAVDRRGNAMIVWCQEDQGSWEILIKTFDIRSKAWVEEPTRLGATVRYDPEPRLAMNRKGQACVVWQERTPGAEGLVVSHFFPSGKQWSDHPMPLASGLLQEHRVAMDMAGNIMALWVIQTYGKRPTIEASMFSALDAEWREPQILATAHKIHDLQLAMTGTGEALALWRQSEGTALSFLHSKAFRDDAWEDRLIRLDAEGGQAGDFTLALGAKSQAALLSIQHSANGDVPVVRSRELQWDPPIHLSQGSNQPLSHPILAVCPKGVVAMWQVGTGSGVILKMAHSK